MPSSFKDTPVSLFDEKNMLVIPDFTSPDEIFIFDYAGSLWSLYSKNGKIGMRPVGASGLYAQDLLTGSATKFGVVRYKNYLVVASAAGTKKEIHTLTRFDLDDEMSATVIDTVSISGLSEEGWCPAVAQDPTTPDRIVWICGTATSEANILAGNLNFSDVRIRTALISTASFTTLETYQYSGYYEPSAAAICMNPGGAFVYMLKYKLNDSLYGNKIDFGDCLDASNAPRVHECTPATAEGCTFAYSADNGGGYLMTVSAGAGDSAGSVSAYLTEKTSPSVNYLGFNTNEEVTLSITFRTSEQSTVNRLRRPLGASVVLNGFTKLNSSVDSMFYSPDRWTTKSISYNTGTTAAVKLKLAVNNQNNNDEFTIQVKAITLTRGRPAGAELVKTRYKADLTVAAASDTTPNSLFADTDRLFSNGVFSDENDTVGVRRHADATPAAETAMSVDLFGTVKQKANATMLGFAASTGKTYYADVSAGGVPTFTELTAFPKSGVAVYAPDVMYTQFVADPYSTGLYERTQFFFRMRNTSYDGVASKSDVVCAVIPQAGG